MRRIKVARICEAFGGGIFNSVGYLMNNLDHDRFEQHLIYKPRLDHLPNDWRQRMHPSIVLHEWNCGREINPVADLRAVVCLYRILREVAPDVIHAHSSKAGLVRMIAPLLGRPVIYTPHAFSFFAGHGSRLQQYVLAAVERLLACSGEIVGVSQSEQEIARRLSHRSSHINNPCDVDSVRRLVDFGRAPARKGHRLRVGMAGRMLAQKNFELFFEVAAALHEEVDFVWIGTRENEQNVPDYVEVTGWLTREACLRQINGLDIYIHTSLWEGVSNTILEAMALEKPVIAYPCLGNKDAIAHCRTGFLANSAEEFIGYIEILRHNPLLRRQLGRRGADFVKAEFDPGRFVQQWAGLYVDRAARARVVGKLASA